MASEMADDVVAHQGTNSTWDTEGWNGTAEGFGTNTEHSDQQVQHAAIPVDPVQSNSSSDSVDIDEDSAGEYDPESVTITTSAPAPVAERSASTASSRPPRKPKTAGGFLVASSDDEDDAPAPTPKTDTAQNLKPPPDSAQAPPTSYSPVQQTTASQNVPSYAAAQVGNETNSTSLTTSADGAATARARLPTDVIGRLEDRVKEDPRGDIDAWLALIDEQKRRHKIDDTRAVYERFLEVFPHAADIWVAYQDMELSLDNFNQAENVFTRNLLRLPSVALWTAYLNYIRRRNDVNDPSGQARQTVNQSYEFVLDNIGHDRDAGPIWQDYIHFLKTGPGDVHGSSWQDKQKMDMLRKAYQRAICVPMANLHVLWKEYDQFELGLNKMSGRKFLQERSPSYMTARSANTHLENITRGLQRTTLPRLPPAPGFDGDQEYLDQVQIWKYWIAWEKEDPLVIKTEDPATYQQRILHVYKQALMALRFWPEMWVDAAEWCFENGVFSKDGQDAGMQFLLDGTAANPESPLLALKHADRIESTQRTGEDVEAKATLAQAVRAPYDKVLDTLYEMIKKLQAKEKAAIKMVQDTTTENSSNDATGTEDEDEYADAKPTQNSAREERIKAVKDGFAVQIKMLTNHISYLWTALARAFRRIQGQGQGQGKGNANPSGLRGIFIEARRRGRVLADFYVAVAHIEWECYQDNVATKIFDRGSTLYQDNEQFFIEYLKHLHGKRDFTNAQVVFSQTVKRWREDPENLYKLKPLFAYAHSYESRFGELAKVKELEKQMSELFPGEPVTYFAKRFATETFNPITARVIVSPAQQMRPKGVLVQSVERVSPSARSTPQPAMQSERSPRPHFLPVNVHSPKRPLPVDDQDDYNPPKRMARGVSPLKGAAGRRLDQQRRHGTSTTSGAPAPIPRDVTFLMSLIPPADVFHSQRFNTEGMIRLVRDTVIPDYGEWKSRNEQGLSRAHTRQASSEYPTYAGRDSPGVTARPASPYTAGVRGLPPVSAPYRNSPLRPGSGGSYEPPPAVYQGPGPSQFNPMAHASVNENAAYAAAAAWQQQYANPYGGAPGQQPPQYGGYY